MDMPFVQLMHWPTIMKGFINKFLAIRSRMVGHKSPYEVEIRKAVEYFWSTREKQASSQKERQVRDQGTRGAVTGGKQMDGFVALLRKIAIDMGVPQDCIYVRGNELPGYFRATKDWDFIIISPKKHLICCIEMKSQVGSFGNNFNNRTEEALGSAVDIWTAFREGAFSSQEAPWLGYLIVVEKSKKSMASVRIREPHFSALTEFKDTSYLDRYKILCTKLVMERHYTSAALIWTARTENKADFGYLDETTSMSNFVDSFIGYLKGKQVEWS